MSSKQKSLKTAIILIVGFRRQSSEELFQFGITINVREEFNKNYNKYNLKNFYLRYNQIIPL